jgi:fructose transport system substrate-binding protein
MSGRLTSRLGRGRGLAITAAVAALTLALAACGSGSGGSSSSSSSSGAQVIVGLITKTDTNPFFVKMKEGAQKAADEAGAKLLTAAGKSDGDNASQVTAIENMVNAGAKGILITPSDTKAIIPAITKARSAGVEVIALDTPTDPQSAVDALFATNNFDAGLLIGKYAKAVMGSKPAKIAMLDLKPGITVGVLRHNGFLTGFGAAQATQDTPDAVTGPSVVCANDTEGNQAKGLYTINEPAAAGAYTALKAAGKEKDVLILSVDGGCDGVRQVQSGAIAATSQQYPLKMASQGVAAIVDYAKNGKKASGYTDTGVNLITAKPQAGVDSKDVQFGLDNCWG